MVRTSAPRTDVAGVVAAKIERIVFIGALPGDALRERLAKGMLALFALLLSPVAGLWGVLYLVLGRPVAAAIPIGYAIFSLLSLAYFARTKRYGVFRASQIALLLLLPSLLQATLGGFVAASGVALWGMFSPLGAVLFHGRRAALPWLGAYLALVAALALLDGTLARLAPPMPAGVVTAFFVLNIGGATAVTFALVQYFAGQVQQEQARADELLLNILPGPIAERLKHDQHAIADGFAEVTVLFADIVDFTTRSAAMAPVQVVGLLNELFSAFDSLAERHGLEKIKTIGDAYMGVAGLPTPSEDHTETVAEMALDMQALLASRAARTGDQLSMRIGINSGPVVAGVIGSKKFIYDLWGDTVNVASRMESQGVAAQIQVTQPVYERLRTRFLLEPRGAIDVKGRGEMQTYLLVGRREERARPDWPLEPTLAAARR